jgi:hypothetical protein
LEYEKYKVYIFHSYKYIPAFFVPDEKNISGKLLLMVYNIIKCASAMLKTLK